ncbi:MAG TPA: ankyrin repeat domain-containing protein [Azospirillum sp.]|nr:ankyrin repeat domain-containing protein [Azospirillum sp.]
MGILRSWPMMVAAFIVGLTLPTLQAAETPVGPLHRAAAAGNLTEVKRLIADGMPADERDAQRRPPLLLAVEGGHDAIAKALLDAGASPNAQADNRDTPWLLAGAKGRTEMLAVMLAAGPDLSIRNRFGGNALIPACERAHVDTVRLLLGTAIDVNHVNDLGWTCLLEAVILGDGGPRHQTVTQLVLEAGADPNHADREGLTPLDHARRRGQEAVARLIGAAGGRSGAAAPSGQR